MKKFANLLPPLLVTGWVGALWGIGYVAVPVLFQTLPDRMLAGILAGKMFNLVAWIGIVSAFILLLQQLGVAGKAALGQTVFRVITVMLLLTVLGQFVLSPMMADLKAQALPAEVMHSVFAERFRLMHGISSILYLIQSLLGIVLVLKISRY